jgi:hypothetical protein
MVLNTGIPVLRKFRFKNLQKTLFEESQAQDQLQSQHFQATDQKSRPYSWEINI